MVRMKSTMYYYHRYTYIIHTMVLKLPTLEAVSEIIKYSFRLTF